jgi:hypothetical protein
MGVDGVSGGGNDQSALDWAAGTIAAAEAYQQEANDRAWDSRTDGIDDPPKTAEERALDAFWKYDPNRPAPPPPPSGGSDPGGGSGPTDATPGGTGSPDVGSPAEGGSPAGGSPTGTTAGGGPRPVVDQTAGGTFPLTAQQAAKVVAEGGRVYTGPNGQIYLDTSSTDGVAVTSKAEPEPPPRTPNIYIAPDHGGGTTTTTQPPPSEEPPAPPPENAAPASETPPSKTEVTVTVEVGLGEKTDAIINKSKTLQQHWAELQAKGWQVKYGPEGQKGSYCDRNSVPPTIVLDARLKNNPVRAAETFAHEVGHARYTPRPEVGMEGKTREEYIRQNLDRNLDDEGAAAFENAKIMHEMRLNGGPADFTVGGQNAADYLTIYGNYYTGRINEEQAKHDMGQIFADRERTSTTGQTYREYYSAQYEKKWDDAHPPEPYTHR